MDQLQRAVRKLSPGIFAFVMATGIVSTAFELVGWQVPSRVLLTLAIAAAAVLAIAAAWRVAAFRTEVLADLRNPHVTFGFFTAVAGANVIGVRLDLDGHQDTTVLLGLLSAVLWLLLTYAVPAALLLSRSRTEARPAALLHHVNGSWFLWVVGTQSLATAAASIGRSVQPAALGAVAIGLWGVGVVLYLLIATLVTLNFLTAPIQPESLSPSYWICMGATAITVLAGSQIMLLPEATPVLRATGSFVPGTSFVLWALGLWWIPLLVIFGIWRHGMRGVPLRFEPAMWSIVFPLGMYAAASILYGRSESLEFMERIGEVGVWVAGAAWLAVTVMGVVQAAGNVRGAAYRRLKG